MFFGLFPARDNASRKLQPRLPRPIPRRPSRAEKRITQMPTFRRLSL